MGVLERFPDDKARRDAEWARLAGKAPDSLYRRLREVRAGARP